MIWIVQSMSIYWIIHANVRYILVNNAGTVALYIEYNIIDMQKPLIE